MIKKSNNYDSSSIQVLEGLEAVRKRPGMYIGNVDNKGLHHLVWEIIDNSIDEVLAGYSNKIIIEINKDGSASIEDDGRGIPVDIHPKTNVSTVETVFTVLHAGGKFGGDNSGYKVSGGLHGVGASVTNALSDWLIVNVYRDGREYQINFTDGGQKSDTLKQIGDTNKRGTKVTFLPDFSIFNDGVDSFDIDIISTRIKETAYLNKGLEINLIDHRQEDYNITYKFNGGLIDFIVDLNETSEKITADVIYAEGTSKNIGVEVALQYTTSYQPRILSYVNNIATTEGGTHEQGFFDAILRIINNYMTNQLNDKDKQKFTREDIKEGLTAIISIKHPDPMYEGQTKQKFTNLAVRQIVNKLISEKFEQYLLENPTSSGQILAKIRLAAKSRMAAVRAKEATRRKDYLEFSTLPGKLADCSSRNVEETELFIVEGDSAGGSAKMGRDREIQAILPLRGKVINSERARIDKLFNNNEINSMITAFGASIGESFNISKLRYGKIIIMTDADVDGSHIRTLLLTFFYRYFKQLIEGGYIYIACPPLFKITRGKIEKYIYTEKEREEYISKIPKGTKISIQRYKGLGEMNDHQLWETTMDPENRKLLKVDIEDDSRAEKVFSSLMGELVEARREFITKNALFAKLDV
ncbi:MAG: DNA topoisomerase (ATP-hydrolyzing) subunit B [Mycoplasmataceae bacterium]|nr:DNA topoisomerase (ATP-hydrolyzing) subunit B [Mycoplasmataceae bacterium]